jgi:TRAP transporter 4TM/12TM fusion protein
MRRQLDGTWKIIFYWLAVFFAGFYLFTSGFGIFSTESNRGMYIMLNVILTLMLYSGTKKPKDKTKVPLVDIFLMLLAVISYGYWMLSYYDYCFRSGNPTTLDTVLGIVGIVLVIEAIRRSMGNVLVIVCAVFLGQLYFGPYLPGILSHRGFSIERIIEFNYSTMEGVFGVIADTFATYVFPFIILGGFFEFGGAGEFFIRLAQSASKGWVGGPAKMAVMASALFGSISGSPVANAVSTGAFTIPLMKKAGFKPEEAAAVEACASTGGQFLPPVMGAAAFLLATFTETEYITICLMNLIPAGLYFYWMFCSVHARAKKRGIMGDPDAQITPAAQVFKEGWFHFVPLAIVVVVMVAGYSPTYAAFFAILSEILLSWFNPKGSKYRITPKTFCDALAAGSTNNLSVGSTIGGLGIITAGIILAGLGAKFGTIILYLSGGYLLATVALVGIVAIFIGMGATQTATYIVTSLVAVPALQEFGVHPLVSHTVAFWVAGLSNTTPPVAVTSYAAAGIAGADPVGTAFRGLKYATMMYVIPFAFIYFPEILLQGSKGDTLYITLLYLIAIPIGAAAIQGYLFRDLRRVEMYFLGLITLGLFIPNLLLNIGTLGVFLGYLALFNKPTFAFMAKA